MQFPSLDELHARGTRKWTVFDEDVLPLWIAESDFPTAPAVKQALQEMVDNETFGYTPSPKASGLPRRSPISMRSAMPGALLPIASFG